MRSGDANDCITLGRAGRGNEQVKDALLCRRFKEQTYHVGWFVLFFYNAQCIGEDLGDLPGGGGGDDDLASKVDEEGMKTSNSPVHAAVSIMRSLLRGFIVYCYF